MAILPGAAIGILGGGQLGRMTAMAARSMGYHIRVLDPDPSCAARFVVDKCVTAAFDNEQAAAEMARECAVVTIEIEKIGLASMDAAARHAPVRPGRTVLHIVQNRVRQKNWLREHGLPVGEYRVVRSAQEVESAAEAFGGECFVKASTGGYDGRGQFRLHSAAQAEQAWRHLNASECVVEKALEIEFELSVLVARRPQGELIVYPPALNHHENRILTWSVIPASGPPKLLAQAQEIARAIAESIRIEGLLAVEIFCRRDGSLLVNELAPRPHNTYHASERACVTGQFEQVVRAVCDLPLGSAEVIRPAAIVNLLGDLWLAEKPPAFDAALNVPGVRLHLYGKRVARPGRKMGHLSATGLTIEEAVERVHAARAKLSTEG